MNKFLAIAVLAITLTTGFTCSKNATESAQAPTTTQENKTEAAPETSQAAPKNEEAAPSATE